MQGRPKGGQGTVCHNQQSAKAGYCTTLPKGVQGTLCHSVPFIYASPPTSLACHQSMDILLM